jgi:hypothetical protein
MNYAAAVILVLFLLVGSAYGQSEDQPENQEAKKHYLYEWTDSKGTVHITDGLGKVPERYRDRARKVESSKGQEPGPEQWSDEAASGSESQELEDEAKAEWQYRMREWRRRLSDAESQHRKLEQERTELIRAWGSIALAPPAYRQRAVELELQLKEVETEIETARNMIDTVLPDEARKAGVPPGWLRQ